MFRSLVFALLLGAFADASPYIVFLVDARQLDYTDCSKFLKTVAKHPSDYSKNGDVGHAWIYLEGDEGVIEGGHSGELGVLQPKYMEGVMENIALGAKNPISYLWAGQCDGFFQPGNGGHMPTAAAYVELTDAQYMKILSFIHTYPFSDYSIQGHQCSSFVREIAALIGIELEDKVIMQIPKRMHFDGEVCQMWEDPCYQSITFSSPDRLQVSLNTLIRSGEASNALSWYRKTHKRCLGCRLQAFSETVKRFPERWQRLRMLSR